MRTRHDVRDNQAFTLNTRTTSFAQMQSVSTNLYVTCYSPMLSLFRLKCLSEQNCPCHKIGQGQPMVMIYINCDRPEFTMLLSMFGPPVSEKINFLRF